MHLWKKRGIIMKTLIIYAHPNTGGHCRHILSEAEKSLKENKTDYEVLDLYKTDYDPVLHEKEHYTAGNHQVSSENRKIQKQILTSDHLIFIYPIWWAAPPAILKGWIDRVLVSGFGFKYEGSRPKGLLKGKRATVFATSGSPKIFYKLMLDPPKRIMKDLTLRFCGIKTEYHQIGRCTKLDDKKKDKIRKIVRKALS